MLQDKFAKGNAEKKGGEIQTGQTGSGAQLQIECVADFDQGSEMIIFESILTTFEPSRIFGGSWGSIENWLEPKNEPLSENLACPNP